MSAPRFKPTLPEVAPLISAYYTMPGVGLGGSLHIVFEDGNLEDRHVAWCARYASDEDDLEGELLARLLLAMSQRQRRRVYQTSFYPEVWVGHLPRADGVRASTPASAGGDGSSPLSAQLLSLVAKYGLDGDLPAPLPGG